MTKINNMLTSSASVLTPAISGVLDIKGQGTTLYSLKDRTHRRVFRPNQNENVDGYKLGHIEQYVPRTEYVGANMTPRSNKLARVIRENYDGKVVWVGMQMAVHKMVAAWDETFFSLPKEEVMAAYARRVKNYLGPDNGDMQITAMGALHDLGYLPLHIKSLPEGLRVPMQVPVFTITNTHKGFYWLTNYCETFLSANVWPVVNAASLAGQYAATAKKWGDICGTDESWLGIANHCFAARGHRGDDDAMISGMGHLAWGIGSDTLHSVPAIEHYYGTDSESEVIACSVNAFEHATATQRIAYYKSLGFNDFELHAEQESLRDIFTNMYPTGIVSYVADSNDYFGVMTRVIAELKEVIMSRSEDSLGLCKAVFRPDSSLKTPLEVIVGDHYHVDCVADLDIDLYNEVKSQGYDWVQVAGQFYKLAEGFVSPVEWLSQQDTCGDDWKYSDDYVDSDTDELFSPTPYELVPAEVKGSLQLLWDCFGGDVDNEEGLRRINDKVGLIYGEAITIEMQERIFSEMHKRGWACDNVLMGTGSWGYLEGSSRDCYGFALKGTNSVVDGVEVSMQKNPKTSGAFKKSARGRLAVFRGDDGELYLKDNCTETEERMGLLQTVFLNNEFINHVTWTTVKSRLKETL